MASTQQIKSRIGSVKNTRQITKAMELVAASKMRRAQDAVGRTRVFSQAARELLTRLREMPENSYDLFLERPVKSRLLIVIGSDRGLAGAYNSNVLKVYTGELKKDETANIKNHTIVIGRQVANVVARIESASEIVGIYRDFPENPGANDLHPIITTAVQMFLDGTVDAVDVVFTHYQSSIIQTAQQVRLLPAGFEETEVSEDIRIAEFEPTAEEVLESATLRLIEVQLAQAVLDSVASEHSMRMMAMKSATDNANDLVDDLTLAFNNARQSAITQELAEITGGAEAMK